VSEDERVEIRENSLVRVRLIGLNFDAGMMSAVGTIKETYLGQLGI
jgi:DNA-directed RNA polymerase subunit E'/Rpb7